MNIFIKGTSMSLDAQVIPTAFYGNGKKQHIDRKKLLHPTGHQGIVSDFCSFAEAVLSHEHFPFLHASGHLVMACSAGRIEGTSTHLGCDTCSESNLGIFPSPSHSLHEDMCHIFSDLYTNNKERGQFLPFYSLLEFLHYPKSAWSHPQSHRHWASTRQQIQ